jgi:putative peptidoglycan binding protein
MRVLFGDCRAARHFPYPRQSGCGTRSLAQRVAASLWSAADSDDRRASGAMTDTTPIPAPSQAPTSDAGNVARTPIRSSADADIAAGRPRPDTSRRVPLIASLIMMSLLIGFGLWHVAGEQIAPQVDTSVLETETLLDQLGFQPGLIDGVADAETAAAISTYQQAAGLPVDGRATPALLEELRAVAATVSHKSP